MKRKILATIAGIAVGWHFRKKLLGPDPVSLLDVDDMILHKLCTAGCVLGSDKITLLSEWILLSIIANCNCRRPWFVSMTRSYLAGVLQACKGASKAYQDCPAIMT